MSVIKVSWKGEVRELDICRSDDEAAKLMHRWHGAIVIEQVFEIISPSSHRARVHLANRVLREYGESTRLDVGAGPRELTAKLKALSGVELPPLPEPEIDAEFEEEEPPAPELELASRDPRTLTGAEKAELARSTSKREAAAYDPKDPTSLTGDQKRALALSGGLVKQRPRQPLAERGIDPTALTGAQKRGLMQRPRMNEVILPPRDPNLLSDAERTELGMLRASQGPIEGLEANEGEGADRAELRVRRTWTRKPKEQPPAA